MSGEVCAGEFGVWDAAAAMLLLIGLFKGWQSGFFRQIASTAGFFAGLFAAWLLYAQAGDFIAPYAGGDVPASRAIAFILLWLGVPILLSCAAWLLTKAFDIVCLGFLNRAAGAAFGATKYLAAISCLLNVLNLTGLWMPAEGSFIYYDSLRSITRFIF